MGVNNPLHVISQGVPVGQTDSEKVRAIRSQFKNESDVISVKIAQFMASGIPVVARDLDESFVITEAQLWDCMQNAAGFYRGVGGAFQE